MSLSINQSTTDKSMMTVSGRLDTTTAPELDAALEKTLPALDSLTLDFANLEYISSAGLRVILKAHKALAGKDGLKLINVGESVKEVFEITGFTDFLAIG